MADACKDSNLVLFLPKPLPPFGAGKCVVGVQLPHEVGGDFNVLLAKVLRAVSPPLGGTSVAGS